jgi:hypothetical protein
MTSRMIICKSGSSSLFHRYCTATGVLFLVLRGWPWRRSCNIRSGQAVDLDGFTLEPRVQLYQQWQFS